MIKPAVFVQFILRLPIVKLMSRSRLGEGQVQVRSKNCFLSFKGSNRQVRWTQAGWVGMT